MASTPTAQDTLAARFAEHRGHLIGVAYRLTGTRADAEDAVQESWLRLAGLDDAGQDAIRDLRGWLTTVVGRICLDRLKSAAAQRERYVGQWLPEPVVTPFGQPVSEDPLDLAVRDDGLRMAALVVLDKLTPEQRVAFVLHDAFSLPFAEIADILGCSVDAARQHGSRGRRALADADPAPRAPLDEQAKILEKFVTALLAGDIGAVVELLHPDAVLIGDSTARAAPRASSWSAPTSSPASSSGSCASTPRRASPAARRCWSTATSGSTCRRCRGARVSWRSTSTSRR